MTGEWHAIGAALPGDAEVDARVRRLAVELRASFASPRPAHEIAGVARRGRWQGSLAGFWMVLAAGAWGVGGDDRRCSVRPRW